MQAWLGGIGMPVDHTPDPRRRWVAAVIVNGRIYCGPVIRYGTNVKTVATAARNRAKKEGREREVDVEMLDAWQREEVARRMKLGGG